MRGTLDVHRELLARAVPHEIVRLPRPVFTADELPDALGVPAAHCLAVRLFEVDGAPVAVLLPVGAEPDTEAILAAVHGDTIRPAAAGVVNLVTDYAAGLVAPLPLPDGVPLLADVAVGGADVVYTPTGETATALGIRGEALLAAAGAQHAEVTRAQPLPVAAR